MAVTPAWERIAVFRALPGLGDLLCAVPALRSLRALAPAASITVIGLPVSRLLSERFGAYVDEVVEFPGHPALPERPADPGAYAAFVERMRARRFDLALQLHGSGEQTNAIVSDLGARASTGFAREAGEAMLPFDDDAPEPERNLQLIRALGGDGGPELEFPVREDDRRHARALAGAGRIAVIHPGASRDDRRWPPACFAEVADALTTRGLRIVLTGTAAERALVAETASAMDGPAICLAGETPVGTLAALVEQAAIVVCNDTGVSHLAAAVATPSVVVVSTSNAARWAPLDRSRHRIARGADGPAAVLGEALGVAA